MSCEKFVSNQEGKPYSATNNFFGLFYVELLTPEQRHDLKTSPADSPQSSKFLINSLERIKDLEDLGSLWTRLKTENPELFAEALELARQRQAQYDPFYVQFDLESRGIALQERGLDAKKEEAQGQVEFGKGDILCMLDNIREDSQEFAGFVKITPNVQNLTGLTADAPQLPQQLAKTEADYSGVKRGTEDEYQEFIRLKEEKRQLHESRDYIKQDYDNISAREDDDLRFIKIVQYYKNMGINPDIPQGSIKERQDYYSSQYAVFMELTANQLATINKRLKELALPAFFYRLNYILNRIRENLASIAQAEQELREAADAGEVLKTRYAVLDEIRRGEELASIEVNLRFNVVLDQLANALMAMVAPDEQEKLIRPIMG